MTPLTLSSLHSPPVRAALGLTLRPDPGLQDAASREGWIALPTAPLTALA
jgi:hypothetical protein